MCTSDLVIWFLIAGPCVIESEKLCLQTAAALKKACDALGIFYVFKASFDKANRTSAKSFRGIGLERGLEILGKVRAEFRRAGADGHPLRRRTPPSPARWWTSCKSPRSLPADGS